MRMKLFLLKMKLGLQFFFFFKSWIERERKYVSIKVILKKNPDEMKNNA